jgi:hypothetical protein
VQRYKKNQSGLFQIDDGYWLNRQRKPQGGKKCRKHAAKRQWAKEIEMKHTSISITLLNGSSQHVAHKIKLLGIKTRLTSGPEPY